MKIEGLRILDSNFYHQLTICDDKIVVQRLDSMGRVVNNDDDDEVRWVKSTNSISSEIRGLDDQGTIDRVVEYYLNYNKITGVYTNIDSNKSLYCVFMSSIYDRWNLIYNETKRLGFQEIPDEMTFKKIMDKYRFDREGFLINLVDDASRFEFCIEDGNSYYQSNEFSDGNKNVCFVLCVKKDSSGLFKLEPSELEFFEKAVDVIMGEDIARVSGETEYNKCGSLIGDHMSIYSGEFAPKKNVNIAVPFELRSEAQRAVLKHNKKVLNRRREQEKVEGRVYQLKMEGF